MKVNQAWEKISKEFNAGSWEKRTADQLRQKFDSLKKAFRREVAGEGPGLVASNVGAARVKPSPITEMLKQILTASAVDMKKTTCDCDDSTQSHMHVEDDKSALAPSLDHGFQAQCLNSDVDPNEIFAKTSPAVTPLDSQGSWETHVPSVLKQTKHLAEISSLDRKDIDLEEDKRTCFARRRRPLFKASGWRKCASGRAPGSKRGLAALRRKLVREECAARERRERELHKRQLAVLAAKEERAQELHGLNVRLLELQCRRLEEELMQLSESFL